jgi:hypothetical protein
MSARGPYRDWSGFLCPRSVGQPSAHTALMGTPEPPPAELPRVTDAGRFAVLHVAAQALLDDLNQRYAVERRETKELLSAEGSLAPTVRLVPRTPAAAPLSITFTDFPSVILRLGRWYQQSLPYCGCDACDEEPAELVAELRVQAAALVEGGLWERVSRGLTSSWSQTRLIGPDFNASQRAPLDASAARAARREGFAAAVQWAPWPRRAR